MGTFTYMYVCVDSSLTTRAPQTLPFICPFPIVHVLAIWHWLIIEMHDLVVYQGSPRSYSLKFVLLCSHVLLGLADPWGASNKEETEALPSYDDITSGAIGDPWAGSTMTSVPQPQVPAQPTQPVPLVDPWGFSPSAGTAATVPPAGSAFPTQPQPNPE